MRYAFFLFLSLMLLATDARAASFCVAGLGLSPQCLFDDIKTCRKAVNTRDTSCIVNPAAVLSYSGGARYCRVTSYLSAECIFIDRAQCNKEAAAIQAICIDRMSMNDENNPYRYDDRIQN